MKVLVTRPADAAVGTVAHLVALGHTPVLAPCLTANPWPAVLPDAPAALILTSAQAVPALPAHFSPLPAFCVGDASAARLRAAGFTNVQSANGDADDLFALVTARRLAGLHLLAVARGQGLALAEKLYLAGIHVVRRAVYVTRPAAALPAPALAALAAGEIAAALFYSAETARAFTRLGPPNTGRITACALSQRVAAGLAGLPWRAIHVALAPNEPDLLALLHD